MTEIIEGAGLFIYPLAICSMLAVFITLERLIALRPSRTLPSYLQEPLMRGEFPNVEDHKSAAGRILHFIQDPHTDTEQVKAFALFEVNRMERGLFILDIVISAAPLIGLLGTVTGLVKVFSTINQETGIPEPNMFIQGVALALTTTMIGLAIAIPTIVFNSYLNRQIDTIAARINVGVERLVTIRDKQIKSQEKIS